MSYMDPRPEGLNTEKAPESIVETLKMPDNKTVTFDASQYRKKPVTITAHQWFKNGDHPQDYSRVHDGLENGEIRQFYPEERKAAGWEGDIVRYFRHPDVPGDSPCEQCGKPHHVHGWIDTLEQGHRVCPGDWIIKGIAGEFYPCKPDIFAATYEPAVAPSPEAQSARKEAVRLPDGSGFIVASLSLPSDHWLYASHSTKWDDDRDTSSDTPHPIISNEQRDAVIAAIRYAVRGATMCGQEMDFDPDALVLNAAYALCGPVGNAAPVNGGEREPCAYARTKTCNCPNGQCEVLGVHRAADAQQACSPFKCEASKDDGILCAEDDCDRANGVRPADAQQVGGDEREAYCADMLAAGAKDLGNGTWEWDGGDFLFQLWRQARAALSADGGEDKRDAERYRLIRSAPTTVMRFGGYLSGQALDAQCDAIAANQARKGE